MKTTIINLKKGQQFIFNDKTYTVKQKFSDWKKNNEPYLITKCSTVFWNEDLEVYTK